MRKPIQYACAIMAMCAGVYGAGIAHADTDLHNSVWSSPSDAGCGIDISFNGDGTATVSEEQLGATHRDTAHWTIEGSEFHLTYDTWHGGIDGAFWQGGTLAGVDVESIRATETYQDSDSGAERSRSCTFQKTE